MVRQGRDDFNSTLTFYCTSRFPSGRRGKDENFKTDNDDFIVAEKKIAVFFVT